MTEKEVWLILYQAMLSSTDCDVSDAADLADKALREYEIRWGEEDDG